MLLARFGFWTGAFAAFIAATGPAYAQYAASDPEVLPQSQANYSLNPPYQENLAYPDQGAAGQAAYGLPPLGQETYASHGLEYIFTPHLHEGFFIQYDGLLWSINSPDNVLVGEPGTDHVLIVNSLPFLVRNTFTTNWDDPQFDWGHRIDFGNISQGQGWTSSVMYIDQGHTAFASGAMMAFSDPQGLLLGYQDANNDNIDDDIDGDGLNGRTDGDLDDLVEYIVEFDSIRASNTVNMAGIDLMRVNRTAMSPAGRVLEWSWGVRYLKLTDDFRVTGIGGVLGTSSWHSSVDNHIVGPQLGARYTRDFGPCKLAVGGRFLAGVNLQKADLFGRLATEATPGESNAPVNLGPITFRGWLDREEFSPLGEIRVDTIWKVSEYVALRLGYTGMFMGGISRGGPKVEFALPEFRLSNNSSLESIIANAMHLGIEINR